MNKPTASLSLDLDNLWSYMKTHGEPGWDQFPSYLDVVVPRILEFLDRRQVKLTVFVVGQDAALDENRNALSMIASAGHEIGNHSFHHESWLHLYEPEQVEAEIALAEEHIERATGQRPRGFRGPGFSVSDAVLRTLVGRGYRYDGSTLPTFIGPLARSYYFMTARLDQDEMEKRKLLFGRFREGFKPLKPYWQKFPEGQILEIPVTTIPLLKIPFHVSYLLYLRKFSRKLAWNYFRSALAICRLTGTEPSLLLHPLDFLGGNDDIGLEFFPAMQLRSEMKIEFVGEVIDILCDRYEVVTMQAHAEQHYSLAGAVPESSSKSREPSVAQ